MLTFLGATLFFLHLCSECSGSSENQQKCSWNACHKWKPGMLNVHLVPHTHDDAGWLKTVDQYFWGANQSIDTGGVQYILDTVVAQLQRDPRRRFSYCETGFFWQWWMLQTDYLRHQVKKLVNEGQLEFINGGWVQNDEATTHYAAVIQQMSYGLRKLNETFGKCGHPRVAWQIDPFGHSREQAATFAQMGMDAVFFARLHYSDYEKRKREKRMEFIWKGSDNLGNKADLFTGILYNGYGPPPGFCFDERCRDDPIMDDKRLEGYNLPEKLSAFLNWTSKQHSAYRTNHIMLTMGSDFQYKNADMWFNNMDKLIMYIDEMQAKGGKVNVFYSTPSCYVRAVNEAKPKLTTKNDDFFPYASGNHSYWTGFFTSRPALKGYVRQSNGLLQLGKQLDATARLGPADFGDLDVGNEAFGFVQHHDGVSGTEKQHVANDYAKRLHSGNVEIQQVVNDAFARFLPKSGATVPRQTFCFLINETVCNVSELAHGFVVTVMNPQAHPITTLVRIPIIKNFLVQDPNGTNVQTQVVKNANRRTQVPYRIPAPYTLVFSATVPPLGFSSFYLTETSEPPDGRIALTTTFRDRINRVVKNLKSKWQDTSAPLIATLKNEHLELTFNDQTGLLSQMKDVSSGHTVEMSQNFFWYKSAIYGNKTWKQPSGAYIFRPNGTEPNRVTTGNVKLERISGPIYDEIRQIFSPWLIQSVRLYKGKPYAELEWMVGPIPYSDKIGKEIISRFDTSIRNNGLFYTDSNGRQMMQRKRNFQPTYTYDNTEPVSGNYYPVNTRIYIKDSSSQFTVLTDRSQGGGSIKDGSLELMVHRRLFEDDGFGVDEALNETGVDGRGLVVTGRHWIVLSSVSKAPVLHRTLAMDLFYAPPLAFASTSLSSVNYRQQFNTQFSGLTRSLPKNVHLLTLEQWQASTLLIRLEHIFQKNEDTEMSKPVTVSLKGLFSTFDIISIEEMNLAANELLSEGHRYDWKEDRYDTVGSDRNDRSRDLNRWSLRQEILQGNDHHEFRRGRHHGNKRRRTGLVRNRRATYSDIYEAIDDDEFDIDPNVFDDEKRQECTDPRDSGNWCEAMTFKWYYDGTENRCKGYHYTGCGKTTNLFNDKKACERKCLIQGQKKYEAVEVTDSRRVKRATDPLLIRLKPLEIRTFRCATRAKGRN